MKSIRLPVLMLSIFCLTLSVSARTVWVVADEFDQMKALGEFLQKKSNITLQLFEQKNFPAKIPSSIQGVIEFVHMKLDDPVAQTIMDYTLKGGKTVILHHGISSGKKETKGWYEFLGVNLDQSKEAKFPYHYFHDTDFSFVNLNPAHYITSHNVHYSQTIRYRSSDTPSEEKEYPALVFKNSEVFVNHAFTDGREKTVLFGFTCKNPQTGETIAQDRSGWCKPKGKGWIFYFHPGHITEDYRNSDFCQIILNCFTWKPR